MPKSISYVTNPLVTRAARMALVTCVASGITGCSGSLRQLRPEQRVVSITHCRDTYQLTTSDGQTLGFWERNLRFRIDSSESGPLPGAPAIVSAEIQRENAVVIFSAPEEISAWITPSC